MQINSRTKVVFKDYSPNQILLLPPSMEEMIDPNHPVRVVNQVIESLDIEYRSQSPADVKAVFGIIKGNRNYRKFLLRGLEKVEI